MQLQRYALKFSGRSGIRVSTPSVVRWAFTSVGQRDVGELFPGKYATLYLHHSAVENLLPFNMVYTGALSLAAVCSRRNVSIRDEVEIRRQVSRKRSTVRRYQPEPSR